MSLLGITYWMTNICCSGATAVTDGTFRPGDGAIHFDNVACLGSESSVFDCVLDSDTTDCSHVQDAGIMCSLECECMYFQHRV